MRIPSPSIGKGLGWDCCPWPFEDHRTTEAHLDARVAGALLELCDHVSAWDTVPYAMPEADVDSPIKLQHAGFAANAPFG